MKAILAVGAAIFYAASSGLLSELEPIYSANINISDATILSSVDENSAADSAHSSNKSQSKVDPRSIVLRVGIPSYSRLNLQGARRKDHEYYNDIYRIESHCDRHETVAESSECATLAKKLSAKLPYYKKDPKKGRTTRKFLLNFAQLWNAFLRIVITANLVVTGICALNRTDKGMKQLAMYSLIGLGLQLLTYLFSIYVINSKAADHLQLLHDNMLTFLKNDEDYTVAPAVPGSFQNAAIIGLLVHMGVILVVAMYIYVVSEDIEKSGSDFTTEKPLSVESETLENGFTETQQVIPIGDL